LEKGLSKARKLAELEKKIEFELAENAQN